MAVALSDKHVRSPCALYLVHTFARESGKGFAPAPQCRQGTKKGANAPFFFHTSRSYAAAVEVAPDAPFAMA